MRRVTCFYVFLVVSNAACGGDYSPVEPVASVTRHVISDGANEGNEHFFFLPPVVPQPSPVGIFDGTLSPEVQVCAWDGTACTAMLVTFTTEVGYDSETVRVNDAEEHYIVNWHTQQILENYRLVGNEVYRIRVLADGHELGFADLAVVNSGKELKNVNTDEYVALKDGRTLAIKFRIEEGAIQEGPPVGIVTSGPAHACTVVETGDAYCWGSNSVGQLGNGERRHSERTPVLVSGGHSWQMIQASSGFTCGLTDKGEVYCWGLNAHGQLGLGTVDYVPRTTPQLVVGGFTFVELARLGALGNRHACALVSEGDVYCWGDNARGQLGFGSRTAPKPEPRLVTGGHSFSGNLSVERNSTCGLREGGDVLCWGGNFLGELGRGFVSGFHDAYPIPALVAGGHTFVQLSGTCGIDDVGRGLCWGGNSDGQVGDGTTSRAVPSPTFVLGGHVFRQVSQGSGHVCGTTPNGTGFCWGQNRLGQLGLGFLSDTELVPTEVAGEHSFEALAASFERTCALASDNKVYCWGKGPLGDGSIGGSSIPVAIIDRTLP